VALDPARDLNNGQPAALARWIEALNLKSGQRVYHLGCGVGYYTGSMAEVLGSNGHVCLSEIDAELAARSQANLATYPNVFVHAGDGADFDPGECDAILINAGVTRSHPKWLGSLCLGGSLMLLLTVMAGMGMAANLGKGLFAKIIREPDGFSTRVVSFVAIYSCSSVRDREIEPLFGKAMATGALFKMKCLRQDPHDPVDTCLVHSDDLCWSSA
jgi:protein-L-isoaspartate(D-aspartate) O-methyltransferase